MGSRGEVIILLNAGAGARGNVRQSAKDQIQAALTDAGLDAEVRPVRGRNITAAAKTAVDEKPRLIVAAGGDGTASAVAGAIAGTNIRLGVIPLGTLNHFAKDCGIPTKIPDAVHTLRRGSVRTVDVATVNDVLFLNNVSIGAYPSVVRRREVRRAGFGWGKWSAMAWALMSISRRYPVVRVDLDFEGRREPVQSPFLFVGNNRYDLRLLRLGARQRLDGGELCVYFSNDSNRREIARMLWRSAIGKLSQDQDFRMVHPLRITVRSQRRRIRVAVDGEVRRLESPLQFESRPRALKVMVPKAVPR
ncbi:MAG TPA: diacylglycerol kinase family protein [Candidatus Thermoplasmatota archaeon]